MTRRLADEDVLYRKVDVGQWDDEGLLPDAFIDHYERQSFYVASCRSPKAVLDAFASMKGIQKRFQEQHLDAAKLYDLGFRIAAVSAREIRDLGGAVEADEAGNEFTQSGHVNIRGARDFAEELSTTAKMLTRDETFSSLSVRTLGSEVGLD